jgi:hypothetical protein
MGEGYGVCFTNCGFTGDPSIGTSAFEGVGLRTDVEFGPICNPLKYIVGQFGLYVQSLLVLRTLVDEVGGFDEALGLSEDRDLTFRLSFRTQYGMPPPHRSIRKQDRRNIPMVGTVA